MTTTRRKILFATAGFFSTGMLVAGANPVFAGPMPLKISGDTLRRRLPKDAFEVMQHKATELPGSSPLLAENRDGVFLCAACEAPLFSSQHKFDSGSGWPAFSKPLVNALISSSASGTTGDVRCMGCESHLGHVFSDGPMPLGLRYCINGVAMRFVEEKQAKRFISPIQV